MSSQSLQMDDVFLLDPNVAVRLLAELDGPQAVDQATCGRQLRAPPPARSSVGEGAAAQARSASS